VRPQSARADVTVYYNPVDPQQSVLENIASRDWMQWFVAGVLFLFAAVYLARQ